MVYGVYRFIKLGQGVFLVGIISKSRISQELFTLLVRYNVYQFSKEIGY